MGVSPAIQDLETKNQTFHTYLNGIRNQLNAQANDMNQRIAAQAARWKADYTDAKVMVTGSNIDLHESSSPLDNLKNIINTTTRAVFTGLSAPAGVKVDSAAQQNLQKALSPAVTDMSAPELLVSGKAFDTISSIVHDFDNPDAAVAFNSSMASQDLGFGLQLFIGVGAQTFAASGLFDNKNIYAYAFAYQVHYSLKQVEQYNKQTILAWLTDQLQEFERKVQAIPLPDSADGDAMEKYDTIMAFYKDHIARIQAQIEQLVHGD